MLTWYFNINIKMQAIIACIFTWIFTLIGVSFVFFIKKINNNIINFILTITGSIMLYSVIFLFLIPALESNKKLLICLFFSIGSISIFLFEKILNNKFIRIYKVQLATTLHNIPEGFSLGICFLSAFKSQNSLLSIIPIIFAYAIQNIPDGMALSIPLRSENISSIKCFIIGIISSLLEPIICLLIINVNFNYELYLPYILAFSSGFIFYIILTEFIPSKIDEKNIMLFILIFILMIFLS